MIIYRGGEPLTETIYIKDKLGNPIDLSSNIVTFYLKRSLSDDDALALFSVLLTITDAANGVCQLNISQVALNTLENRYYPYIIKRLSGGSTYFVSRGMLNVNEIGNDWEWDTDIYSGVILSDLVGQANRLLRYRDWDNNELVEWCNDALKDWSKRTNYLISRVKTYTIKDNNTYILPNDILTVRNVYLDGVELYRNRGWMRENNKIILLNQPSGNNILEIKCSKYPQMLTNSNYYAEVVPEGSEGIVYYICWKAKLEDREFSEADYYWRLYLDYVNDYCTKNTIDSTEETQIKYIGQGTSFVNTGV